MVNQILFHCKYHYGLKKTKHKTKQKPNILN